MSLHSRVLIFKLKVLLTFAINEYSNSVFVAALSRSAMVALLLVGPPCSGKSHYYVTHNWLIPPTINYGGQEYGETVRGYAERCRAALRLEETFTVIEMWPEHLEELKKMTGGYLGPYVNIRFFKKLDW
jgi:hypothetical protein